MKAKDTPAPPPIYSDRHPVPLGLVMDTPHGLKDFHWRPWMEYGTAQRDEYDRVREEWCTCEVCGREWNEAYTTGRTPAPSACCPFEDEHGYEDDQGRTL